MGTPTYTALATVTLGSSASSVTFSSIPATYRDLVLVAAAKTGVGDDYTVIRVNSDSGSNYSRVQMLGTGSVFNSGAFSSETAFLGSYFGGTDNCSNTYHFMDYSATDKHKTVLMRTNIEGRTMASANRWASTSAITSIYLAANTGPFQTGSTFALYGIAS